MKEEAITVITRMDSLVKELGVDLYRLSRVHLVELRIADE
jgi:hypothetical protein